MTKLAQGSATKGVAVPSRRKVLRVQFGGRTTILDNFIRQLIFSFIIFFPLFGGSDNPCNYKGCKGLRCFLATFNVVFHFSFGCLWEFEFKCLFMGFSIHVYVICVGYWSFESSSLIIRWGGSLLFTTFTRWVAFWAEFWCSFFDDKVGVGVPLFAIRVVMFCSFWNVTFLWLVSSI